MFNVRAQELKGSEWIDLLVPDKLTDRIEMLAEQAGKQVVIEIQNSLCSRYLCGTPELVEVMRKSKPKSMSMTCGGAYVMVQYTPELFFVSVEAFFGPTDVKRLLPDPPVPKEGWDHLKEKSIDT